MNFFHAVNATSSRPATTRIIQTNLRNSYDPQSLSSWPQTGTTMYDLGSEGLDLTLYGGMENSYSASGWFDMDGVDDRAYTANSNVGGANLSFGVWAYIRSGTTHIVAGRTDNSLNGLIVYCVGANAYIRYKASNGTTANIGVGSQINVWAYYCGSYDHSAGTWNSYVGDAQGWSNVQSTSVSPLNSTSLFNEYGGLGGLVSTDLIGEFHVYDSALSSSDWQSNFNNTKARYGL